MGSTKPKHSDQPSRTSISPLIHLLPTDTQKYKTFTLDGGHEVLAGLATSGEPATGPITALFGTKPVEEATATSITETNKAIKQYRKQYLDYWNEKKVDAVIAPVSPHAAPEIGKLKHFGEFLFHQGRGLGKVVGADVGGCLDYTIWVNLLDYSAAVIPVTRADRDLDMYPAGEYTPLSEQDGVCRDGCMYTPFSANCSSVWLLCLIPLLQTTPTSSMVHLLGYKSSAEGSRKRRSALWLRSWAQRWPRRRIQPLLPELAFDIILHSLRSCESWTRSSAECVLQDKIVNQRMSIFMHVTMMSRRCALFVDSFHVPMPCILCLFNNFLHAIAS